MKSVTSLSPTALRELAAAIEATDTSGQAQRDLSPEAASDLADLLIAGKRPTVGWWQRHTTSPNRSAEWRPNYYANTTTGGSYFAAAASVNSVNDGGGHQHA